MNAMLRPLHTGDERRRQLRWRLGLTDSNLDELEDANLLTQRQASLALNATSILLVLTTAFFVNFVAYSGVSFSVIASKAPFMLLALLAWAWALRMYLERREWQIQIERALHADSGDTPARIYRRGRRLCADAGFYGLANEMEHLTRPLTVSHNASDLAMPDEGSRG